MAKEVKTPAVEKLEKVEKVKTPAVEKLEKVEKVKTMFLLSRNEKRYVYVKKSELIKTNKPVVLGSLDDSHVAIAPEATIEVIESLGKKLLKNYKADFINLSAKFEE